jgi:uncharacterized membrane protein YfcA
VTLLEACAVLLAGVAAGAFNTVVGAGSLISFPTLLAVGLPPVVANVSNTTGLVPGGISGTWGYRRELAGQAPRAVPLVAASMLGAVVGAVLLLVLPEAAFATIAPALVLLGSVLVAVQPLVARWFRSRAAARRPAATPGAAADASVPPLPRPLTVLTGLLGVYGGYFGAGQGVILVALVGLGVDADLQVVNAMKNLAVTAGNATAAVVFLFIAPVNWIAVLLIALGSVAGAHVGARVGRRLPASVLRAAVVTMGLIVAGRLVLA